MGAGVFLHLLFTLKCLYLCIMKPILIRTFVVPNTKAETLLPIMVANVEENSRIITDAYQTYVPLSENFDHVRIKHIYQNYVTKGDKHTNNIEGCKVTA